MEQSSKEEMNMAKKSIETAYFRNTGGPQIVTLHGLVKADEVMTTNNPIVAKGLRSHSRYQEVSKADYEKYQKTAGPQFRTSEGLLRPE
jgi:hypothetical protein